MFDMRLNSHSRLNLIPALLQAIDAGADEALMLDPHGFVSSCNATNFFFVKDGVVKTSTGEYCFNGITRGNVMRLCQQAQLPLQSWRIHAGRSAGCRRSLRDRHLRRRHAGARDRRTRAVGRRCPGPITLRVRDALCRVARRAGRGRCAMTGAPIRIAMWSGPRNISTRDDALLRSARRHRRDRRAVLRRLSGAVGFRSSDARGSARLPAQRLA